MNVHSSTSSSDAVPASRPLPGGSWLTPLFAAVISLCAFVGLMESRLAARGFGATAVDSDQRWLQQRRKADELGDRALILVGASRIQLDLDLAVLRKQTRLEPVQLAVDGSSFLPILEDLAADPRVTGTLLVGYQDNDVNGVATQDRAVELQTLSQQDRERTRFPDFATTEAFLGDVLHDRLRSYADGARPITSLLLRVLDHAATPQYLIMLPDRSRLADYQRVAMPGFYFSRVMRNLGGDNPLREGMSWDDLDNALRQRIAQLPAVEKTRFVQNTDRIAALVDTIRRRGGNVIFLLMPTSALIRELDLKRYPRALYWDQFVKGVGASALNVEDYTALAAFACPDGSHLDWRDRERFTAALLATGFLEWRTGATAAPVPK